MPPAAHFLALVRLSNRRLATLKGVRVARVYAVSLAFSYVLFASALRGDRAQRLAQVVQEALTFSSWLVCGIAVLGVLRAPRGFSSSLAELGFLRGHGPERLQRAYWCSLGLRLATDLLIAVSPALLVIALFAESPSVGQRVGWLLFVFVYALGLGFLVAALVAFSQRVTPQYAAALFLMLLIAPEIAGALTSLPGLGLPGLFSRAIDSVFDASLSAQERRAS